MEPDENDAINEALHPQNSRRNAIERIVWYSNDRVRNHAEILINNIDNLLRQMPSNENDVTQNGSSGEMPEVLNRRLIRNLILASFYQSAIRRYNFWLRRLPEENSDHTVPGIEVSTYLTPSSSTDQVVPCGTSQDSVPIRVNSALYQPNINSRRVFEEQVRHYRDERYFVRTNRILNRNIHSVAFSNSARGTTGYHPVDLTSMRENGPNQNDLSRQDSYIDQTNVNLTVDCQKKESKCKRENCIEVCQNHQECKSRRDSEKTCRLNKCHETTELKNSSSAGHLTSSVTQDSQCQNAGSSTSLENVPERSELYIRLPQNHEAKLSVPSTSMHTCNKERSTSSEKQNNANSSPVNSEIPSTSTKISPSTTAYNTYPESNSDLQSTFRKFSSFSNRNMTPEHNYFRPEEPQFSNIRITSCSSNISPKENLYNDNSSACLKNIDSKNSVIKEKTTSVPLHAFCSSAHIDTREKFALYNNVNECSLALNKPESFMKKNHESISKNSQNEGENTLNPLLLNVVNADMQRAEPILMESCSRNDNTDEYVDSSGSSKPNTEDSTTSISYMKLSKDSTTNSRLVETNQDTEMAETYRKTQIANSHLSNFDSDSVNSAASNKKTDSLNASFEKSEIPESFCDKDKLTITKLNSDKYKNSEVVQSLIGDSDEQVKENIPPDNCSLPK